MTRSLTRPEVGTKAGDPEKIDFTCVLTLNLKLVSARPEMDKWALAVSRSEMRHFSARSRKPGTRAAGVGLSGLSRRSLSSAIDLATVVNEGGSKASEKKSRDCAETYILGTSHK
jgi:hypothetical protein